MDKNNYVLITAARNEERYIENTIRAIISQTVRPVKWIIVSDGSTDRTDEIVSHYAALHNFITLICKTADTNTKVDFASKVHAIRIGHEMLAGTAYDYIGILDADVTFDSFYYENILGKFSKYSMLGIAGGIILDQYSDHQIRRSPANANYVSGCIQMFRRKCYEDIGGLFPIKEGGEDTIAVINAQMKGWVVEAYEDSKVYHHKHNTTILSRIKEAYRTGQMFCALGSHPLVEILKSIKSISVKPFFLFSITRTYGYFLSYFKTQQRPVTEEFTLFLRKEQFSKIKKLVSFKRDQGHD